MSNARRIALLFVAALITTSQFFSTSACAQFPASPPINKHIEAGEFGAALHAVPHLPQTQQAGILGQISGMQASTGNLDAATSTALGGAEPGLGGAGGGAIADFDSLMELIQTTVVPDTWEALGGPSTMSPYAAGVVVNGEGLILDPEVVRGVDQLTMLRAQNVTVSGDPSASDWRAPAELRKVSLRRLQTALMRRGLSSLPPTDAMSNLAGLSRIQYVFLSDDRSDVILAGPVSGVRPSVDGNRVDHKTGNALLQLDALAIAVSATESRRPFGCTIEPTIDGVRNVGLVNADIQSGKLPSAAASPRLKEALGLQEIRVFGTAGDTSVATLMVEADRHMKQLALGTHPMPAGVPNYLDIVEETIAQGPLTGSFLRLWFAARPISLRADAKHLAFELSGRPLLLMSEQEIADQQGQRAPAAPDMRATMFVESFNEHFDDIARDYPLYDRLRGIYDLAAVAQLMKRYLPDEQREAITGYLQQHDHWLTRRTPVPKHTESLVVHRRFHKGRKIHSVVVASGGVQVNPGVLLSEKDPEVYPSLDAYTAAGNKSPKRDDHWWWD